MEGQCLLITIIRNRVFLIRGGDTTVFLRHIILVLVLETKLGV
jgi:hypothetical protein